MKIPLYINDPGILRTREQCPEMTFPEWREYVFDHMEKCRTYEAQRQKLLDTINEKLEEIDAINEEKQDWGSIDFCEKDIEEAEELLRKGERCLFDETNTPHIIIPDEPAPEPRRKKILMSFYVDLETKEAFAEYAKSKNVNVSAALRFYMAKMGTEFKKSQDEN